MAMTLAGTITIPSGGGTQMIFSNIPQTGKDLLLVGSIRIDFSTNFADAVIYTNSSAAGNARSLFGNGSSASSGNQTYTRIYAGTTGSLATANTFSSFSFYLPNYTGSQTKVMSGDGVTEHNGTEAAQSIDAITSTQTAAVTSFGLAAGVNFIQGSTVSLYIIS
jgi:hypothetical protein